MRKSIVKLWLTTAACAVLGTTAHAASVEVLVGYADGLRAGADFPNPFAGGQTYTTGGNTYTVTNFVANLSADPDSGAVLLLNTGSTAVSITNLDVNDRATGGDYQIWTGNGAGQLGSGITLAAGTGAIFAENAGNNFDTSDYSGAAAAGAAETGTIFDPSTNNCSNGPIAASVACKSVAPLVTFTLNSTVSTFTDTAHVLDTGGYDSASANHIHTGGSGTPVFNTNESLNWRPIGTTGIGDPGGTAVPEPVTWAMMLAGFGVIGAAARRRRQLPAPKPTAAYA